tara:strand:- start:65 stop:424 length:360 start_codon:yes stop_codon:yes gene_type:complete
MTRSKMGATCKKTEDCGEDYLQCLDIRDKGNIIKNCDKEGANGCTNPQGVCYPMTVVVGADFASNAKETDAVKKTADEKKSEATKMAAIIGGSAVGLIAFVFLMKKLASTISSKFKVPK